MNLLWLADLRDDARYALRSLRRTWGLTVFVSVTLALGIGLSTATFSMLDGLILRPYPVRQPGQVVTLVGTTRDHGFEEFSYREFLDLRRDTKSYDGVIANAAVRAVGFSAEPGATPRVHGGMLVSGNYFRVLGVEPTLGRGFGDREDEAPGRDAVVVLDAEFWKRELGGDPSVVGKTVRLNGTDFTVIGVAPESFSGLLTFSRPEFYMPLAMAPVFSTDPRKNFFEDRDVRELAIRARLKPDTTLQQARSELALLARSLERDHPASNRDRGATVRTQFEMRTRDDAGEWKFIVVFAGLALAVLLVACTNVAGLLLSRAQARTREIAVRLAIGAGRARLIRMLLTESLLLACIAGLGGIAVAFGALKFFHTLSIPSEFPTTLPFQLDSRVLLASGVLSVISAVLCGLAPALQSTRANLVIGLKAADLDIAKSGPKRLWGRNALVVAQVSMSLMLLAASFLMMRGFQSGVAPVANDAAGHVLMARLDPRLVQYNPEQTQRFYQLLTERIRATAGVQSAGLTRNPPLGLSRFERVAFVPDGFDMPRDRETFNASLDTVDDGFFPTMGIAIVRGRDFLRSDTADAPRVAIVNEQFASHYWPGGDAVGKHLRLDSRTGTPVEIVGIAQTVKYQQTTEKPVDFVYLPLAQRPTARMVLLMRAAGDPHGLIEPLKDLVGNLDANLPISEIRTYADVYRYNAVDGPALGIQIVATMGAVGLVLATAGLYGLVAYSVSRRTREIGIRIAIGAEPADVLRLVMSKGLTLVGIGTAIGLAMGLAVEQLFNAMLFNAGGVDLLAYVVIVPVLLAVTLLAAYVPARRASRIAPTQALRAE